MLSVSGKILTGAACVCRQGPLCSMSSVVKTDTSMVKMKERSMALILRQSRIHSYGCYTDAPIRKGTLIVEYVGEHLTHEQAEDLYDDFSNTYLFGLDGGKR